MTVHFIFNWYTDEDWFLDTEWLEQLIERANFTTLKREKKSYIKKMFEQWAEEELIMGGETYLFESKDSEQVLREVDWLKSMLMTSIRVGWTHEWLMKDIYELFHPVENFLLTYKENKKENTFYNYISGNYDGTEIQIIIEE